MASDTVQQVKERLGIVEVVGGYVKLVPAGGSFKARCPFHNEKSPSFMVSPERGTYHCFGCGVGGDIFTFVQEMEGLDFKGALKVLADRAGVPLVYSKGEKKEDTDLLLAAMDDAARFFCEQLTDTHPARTYLRDRGLSDDTIRSFRIGWAPDDWHVAERALKAKGHSEKVLLTVGLLKEGDKGAYDRFRSRIMFPLFDAAGRVIAFSGRIFVAPPGKPADDVAKYMNSPETPLFHKSQVMYGFDRAKQSIRKHHFSILVEGQMDLVAVHQAGWGNAVAVSGTALTESHVRLLRRMAENILLALDADGAGIAAAQKSAAIALKEGMDVKVAALPEGSDPADLLKEKGKEVWGALVREATPVVTFLLNHFEKEARDPRAYAKIVERQVLPLIKLMPSPIDRDQCIAEVAARIRVSDDAVREGVARVSVEEPAPAAPVLSRAVPRTKIKSALGIILFQEQVPKPQLDCTEARQQLAEALGVNTLEGIIPAHEEEAARYEAEAQYSNDASIVQGFKLLITALHRERLQVSYREAMQALQSAEAAQDEARAKEALELCTTLSKALAQLG